MIKLDKVKPAYPSCIQIIRLYYRGHNLRCNLPCNQFKANRSRVHSIYPKELVGVDAAKDVGIRYGADYSPFGAKVQLPVVKETEALPVRVDSTTSSTINSTLCKLQAIIQEDLRGHGIGWNVNVLLVSGGVTKLSVALWVSGWLGRNLSCVYS